MTAIHDEQALRERYREPHELVLRKQLDHIDAAARAFVDAATFLVIATSSDRGVDASPRGGPEGFVVVLDPHRVAFADLAGNNRLDSYANITRSSEVGLLLFVPGLEETMRLNGKATLTLDPDVVAATAVEGVRPKVAVVVEVSECFVHCGKAVRRGGLFDQQRWRAPHDRPSAAAILGTHLELDVPTEQIAADIEASYCATLWEEGGR